jgi:hypothetical protein
MYPAETRCGSAIGPPLPRTVIDNLRCVIVISEPAWAVNANQKRSTSTTALSKDY